MDYIYNTNAFSVDYTPFCQFFLLQSAIFTVLGEKIGLPNFTFRLLLEID
ncbi:MAG: hypothetical protein AAGI23_11440 [Bacteroidota bacterium]